MENNYSHIIPYTDDNVAKDVELFVNWRRTRYIQRCNNFFKIHSEDVAQHSCFTAQLSLIIADDLNNNAAFTEKFGKVNVETVLRKALLHDMPEAVTSDIPYNVKRHSKELGARIADAETDMMNEAYEGSSHMFQSYKASGNDCKKGLEGDVVNAADMLELAWHCCEEVCMGNQFMKGLLDKALGILEKYGVADYSKFVKTAMDTLLSMPSSGEATKRVYL